MKKTLFLIILIIINHVIFSQSKSTIINEIKTYKQNTINNASYEKAYLDIWNAIYIVATEEYNTITRESESRGYIEGKQEGETVREFLTIQIIGKKSPYRVSFQVKKEKRIKTLEGYYSKWQNVDYSGNDKSYYFKLKKRLYELLNGPLEISDELQKKVDNYNSSQRWDRKKIIKGKHY